MKGTGKFGFCFKSHFIYTIVEKYLPILIVFGRALPNFMKSSLRRKTQIIFNLFILLFI